MAKKRRTRKEKVITKLKRQLSSQKIVTFESQDKKDSKKVQRAKVEPELKEEKNNLFSFDQNLIKKDLKKTAFLSLIFIGLIFGLFIFFEKGGLG